MIGFFHALVLVMRRYTWRTAVGLGIWGGLLIHAKLVYGVSLAGVAVALVVHFWGKWRALGVVLWGLLPFGLLAAAAIGYNVYKAEASLAHLAPVVADGALGGGAKAVTGYGLTNDVFRESLWTGLWGMFFPQAKASFFSRRLWFWGCLGGVAWESGVLVGFLRCWPWLRPWLASTQS